jgi:hypothetical protein
MKKWILSLLVAISLAGCGNFEWFPATGPINQPNSFTFINQCGVPIRTVITSNPITVSGLTSQAPISISNNNSLYSINDGGFTSAAGTISNGQTVKVQHTSADTAGSGAINTIIITTLTIGGVSGTFKTDTNPCSQGSTFP